MPQSQSSYTITLPSTNTSGSHISYNSVSAYNVAPQWSANRFTDKNGETIISASESEASTLEVKGRIKINGEFLDDRLERIETLLNIPTRNVKIEAQYPKLKALFEEYMSELEKYKTWNRMKGNENE